MQRKNKKKIFFDYIWLSILITLWLTFIGVLGNSITDLLDYLKHLKYISDNTLLIIGIKLIAPAIIFLLIWRIYKNRKKFRFYSLAREKDMKNDSFKVVILPISTPNKDFDLYYYDDNNKDEVLKYEDIKEIKTVNNLENFIKQKNIKKITLKLKNINFENKSKELQEEQISPLLIFSVDKKDSDTGDLENGLITWLRNIKDIKWNWSVPLLIVGKNFNSLEHLRLIGSNGDKGSTKELYRLTFILLSLFHNSKKNIDINQHSVESFENFTELPELLSEIEKDLEDNFNYKDEEMAFDITGGQKPVSVVGTFLL